MINQGRFLIRNDCSRPLTLNIEPEGVFFPLSAGEEVSVIDAFTEAPVTLTLSHSDTGDRVVSIWPGDGEVRIEKEGIDILDMITDQVAAENRRSLA